MAKQAYSHGKKRPIVWQKEAYQSAGIPEVCLTIKRDLSVLQKRPVRGANEVLCMYDIGLYLCLHFYVLTCSKHDKPGAAREVER